MIIKLLTFGEGHLVSTKEYDSLKKGFAKVGMGLVREPEKCESYDILMVKGWSHTYAEAQAKNPLKKPLVYLSIGTEWKVGNPDNEPVRELYEKADYVIHISGYCMESHWAVFGIGRPNETVIIPAREPNLPTEYRNGTRKLKFATTCIPRPVKRVEEIQRLAKKFDFELVEAYGTVSDFSYYHDCDGYIHLSRKEGMPNTVLEALAMGLPCIVTNYGGAKEAVGDCGVVIKNDPEGIPWDPDTIEPIDDFLFKEALEDFGKNLHRYRMNLRARVHTELNDYVAACQFKEIFASLIHEKDTTE